MSDNKKYYYIKLKEDFFDDDAMKIIESMPDGYIYSNILLKLYLKSLKHNGKLMFNDRVPYNSTILSAVVGHQVGTVEKAIDVFKQLDLIEVLDDGAIFMLDIQNYIGTSSTEADRKREYRYRIKSEKEALGQMSGHLIGHSSLEIEKEIEIEKEKENRERVDFNSIVDAYHQHCPSFSRVRNLSDARKKAIKARLKTYSEEDLIEAFDKAEASTFLKGGNDRNWTADFDWILKDANLAKILDGKYDNTFQKDKKETNSDAWSIAWEQVQMLIRRYGRTNSAKAYAEMDEITAATVKRLGYINLCNSENIVSERANFRNIYEGIQNGK